LTEIDKAREIGERALKTINFREEGEKMNIWVALMNLENTYGGEEALMKLVEKALQYTNQKTLYFHLIDIFQRSKNYASADTTFKQMWRKFKACFKIWMKYASFQASSMNDMAQARGTLKRSLQVLPKRKHIQVISKWGQLEFKHGFPERGRTIFEGIVANYPKRLDIWSVYLDMELSTGDLVAIRKLFEVVTTLNLSSKKMKYFLKRYMAFEKEHGDQTTRAHVKQKAQEYMAAKTGDV